MKALDPEAARHKAYQLLSLRPHSERELEKKLLGKGFAKTIVKEALEKLHELKYLNDASFANGRARYLAGSSSAYPSRARWPTSRPSCLLMSRPATWTA